MLTTDDNERATPAHQRESDDSEKIEINTGMFVHCIIILTLISVQQNK